MHKILFVCHGNICRSPMAEYVLKDRVKKLNIADDFEIDSCATSTEEIGNPAYPPVRKLLSDKGIDSSSHQAKQFTKEMYEKFDHIILMDNNNLRNIKKIVPFDSDNKIKLLLDYTDDSRDVKDPWYTRDFEATWDDVNKGIDALLEDLGYKY